MTAQSISKKQWLGWGIETTPGTLIATPTVFVPSKAGFKRMQGYSYQQEDRNTRDKNNDRVSTIRHSEGDPKGAWYNDVHPYLLYGFMGGWAMSQPDMTHAATVYKHNFTLTDLPPTLSCYKGYHNHVYTMAYGGVSKLKLKWTPNKELEVESTITGLWYNKYTGATITPTFSTVKAFSGVTPTITLGSLGVSGDIEDMEIDLEQVVTPWYGSSGLPDFARLDYGERHAKVSFTARFDADTLYETYFAANLDDSLTFDIKGALIANSGASGTPPNTPYYQELSLTFPIVGYDTAEIIDSKPNLQVKVAGTPRPGSAVNSLFTGFVQNTIASYAL
jgi:hypothetical protein